MTSLRTPATAVAVALAVAGAAPAAALAKPATVTISGATGSAPLVGLLAKKYVKSHPGKIRFKLAQGGGEVGIQDAAAGRVTIGNASRDPRPSDPPGIVFYPIAKDYFCFDTNPANPLPNLTLAQAQAIWTGAVRDWSQVPGAHVTGTIDLIGRTAASSLPPLVQQLLLGEQDDLVADGAEAVGRPRAAVGGLGQERDRLQLRLVRRAEERPRGGLQRRRLQSARRPSPASTRACAPTTR